MKPTVSVWRSRARSPHQPASAFTAVTTVRAMITALNIGIISDPGG